MNQPQAAPKAPPAMPSPAPMARPNLPAAPLLRAPVAAIPLPTAPPALPLPAVRQVTVATVTRNLQSVLGPAANTPQPPQAAFPGFVSRQFDQVKQYSPATSNEGHLNKLANMFAATRPAAPGLPAPDRRNLPRATPPRPANLPTPAPRSESNLLQTVKTVRLGKLARAKAERLKQQAELAKNQTEQTVQRTRTARAALPKPTPRPEAKPATAPKPAPAPRPQTEAPRPQAEAPMRRAEAPKKQPEAPKKQPEAPKPQPELKMPEKTVPKPVVAAAAAIRPPLVEAKTAVATEAARPPVTPPTAKPAAAPVPVTPQPEDKPVASSRSQSGGELKLNKALPELPKLEFKPIALPQNPEVRTLKPEPEPQRPATEVKATAPQQRSDLADIKVSSGLNEVQRGMLNPQRQVNEREMLPLVEQAGLGFHSQGGGGGQGGGRQQGRRRQDEEEKEQEESAEDAFPEVGVGQRLRGDSQDREWWHHKGGQRPADLKLEMDWLSGPAPAFSSELREATHPMRAPEPAAPVPVPSELVKATSGRDQGQFSDQAPRRDERQAPPRARETRPEVAQEALPLDLAPDLSGLCGGCGTELGPIDPRRCPRCLKANALATLKILEVDANFIAYRVFLTACRQPVASQAVYRLRDFAAVPSGAYWVQPLAA